jgi:hypothetical protein
MFDPNTLDAKNLLNKQNIYSFALSSSEKLKNKLGDLSSKFDTDLLLLKFSFNYEIFSQKVLSLKKSIDSNDEASSLISNVIDSLLSEAQSKFHPNGSNSHQKGRDLTKPNQSRSKSVDPPNIKNPNLNQNYSDNIDKVFFELNKLNISDFSGS